MRSFLGGDSRPRRSMFLGLLVALGVLAAPAGASAALDYTWSGGGSASNPNWSNSTNWGVTGPSNAEMVGTLTFPNLGTCNTTKSACYTSNNDLSLASVNTLAIDDEKPYNITGKGITLNSGLTTTASGRISPNAPSVRIPLQLGANQTWSIDGGADQLGQIEFNGGVTGGSTLGLNFTNGGSAIFGADNEVGNVAATGSGTPHTGFLAVAGQGASLNGSDGHSVSLSNGADFFAAGPGESIGALTMSDGAIDLGDGFNSTLLHVNGGATLNSGSDFSPDVHAGTTPGASYSQLQATGAVNLGGAQLSLFGLVNSNSARCSTLHRGDVDTLVTAGGSLSGTFANAPEGAVLQVGCGGGTGTPARMQIHYAANAVTGTVVGYGLTVPKTGNGSGTVTSSPAGIDCGSTCSALFDAGRTVILKAVPASNSTFAGWSGAGCRGTGTCTVTMSADRVVRANFSVKKCVVPRLKGKTLKKAKKALKRAHCKLGKVTGRKRKHGHVKKQKPKPGKVLAAGSKVSIKLG